MNASISILRPGSNNPATHPELTDTLRASVAAKASAALTVLRAALEEFGSAGELTFANSFGAEDMSGTTLAIDAAYVERQLSEIVGDTDLSKYVL